LIVSVWDVVAAVVEVGDRLVIAGTGLLLGVDGVAAPPPPPPQAAISSRPEVIPRTYPARHSFRIIDPAPIKPSVSLSFLGHPATPTRHGPSKSGESK